MNTYIVKYDARLKKYETQTPQIIKNRKMDTIYEETLKECNAIISPLTINENGIANCVLAVTLIILLAFIIGANRVILLNFIPYVLFFIFFFIAAIFIFTFWIYNYLQTKSIISQLSRFLEEENTFKYDEKGLHLSIQINNKRSNGIPDIKIREIKEDHKQETQPLLIHSKMMDYNTLNVSLHPFKSI